MAIFHRIGILIFSALLCALLCALGASGAAAAPVPASSAASLCDVSHWLCQPPVKTSWIPESHAAAQVPAGYVSFCLRFSDQCVSGDSGASTIALNGTEWDAMQEVNSWINRAIRPMDDLAHYGRAEYWTIPSDGFGDCEDYALTKRRALIERGFPAAALRMAVVMTSDGQRHAVLTVATDHGDFVLGNLTDEIRPWNERGFHWIARQDPKNVWAWVSLEGIG